MKLNSNKIIKTVVIIAISIIILYIIFIVYGYFVRSRDGFDNINYMDGVDVIYWINLDRSPERRENTEKVLADPVFQDIPKIRISATDGKKPDEMYQKLGDYKKQEGITDYEYGCLLSHLDSIKEFSKSGFETAIIFEDDVTLEFQPFWKKSLRQVAKEAPEDWEIIMLWYNVDTNGFNKMDYVKFNGQFYTLAYLINKRGANRLMEISNGQGKYKLVDDYHHKADYYLYSVLNTYVYKYPYFIYKTDNDSEIHQDHVAIFHNKNKKNAETFYELEKNIEPMTGNDNNSSNVIGYIHVCQKEGWKRSFDILMSSIKQHRLYENTKEIRIGVVNDNGNLIDDERFLDDKIKIIHVGPSEEYERPTLLHMKNSAETDPKETVYYYLHTKGLKHFNTDNEPAVLNWINSMLKCNVEKWENAIVKLNDHETYGCNYNTKHYSGNFWWATKDHIKKLPDSIPGYYTAPEDWVLSNKENAYCEYNCPDDYKAMYTDTMY